MLEIGLVGVEHLEEGVDGRGNDGPRQLVEGRTKVVWTRTGSVMHLFEGIMDF